MDPSPVLYDPRGIQIKLPPRVMKHLQVLVAQPLLWVPAVEALQDNSHEEVDDQQEVQEDVGGEKGDARRWAAAVCSRVTVWRRVHDGAQKTVPSRGRADQNHTDQAVSKRLKVKHVADPRLLLRLAEGVHANISVGVRNEEEEQADVEEGRK